MFSGGIEKQHWAVMGQIKWKITKQRKDFCPPGISNTIKFGILGQQNIFRAFAPLSPFFIHLELTAFKILERQFSRSREAHNLTTKPKIWIDIPHLCQTYPKYINLIPSLYENVLLSLNVQKL